MRWHDNIESEKNVSLKRRKKLSKKGALLMAEKDKKWITTENPAIIFEDNAVGRMKKEVWDMTEEQLDKVLEEYGIPSPSELGVAGTYIQNTPRQEQIEKRCKRCWKQ